MAKSRIKRSWNRRLIASLLGVLLGLTPIGTGPAQAQTGMVLGRVFFPGGMGVAFDGSHLWADNGFCSPQLLRLSTSEEPMVERAILVSTGEAVCALAYDRRSNELWGAVHPVPTATFIAIDPTTGQVKRRITSPGVEPVGSVIDGLSFDEQANSLWTSPDGPPISRPEAGIAYEINPTTGAIRRQVPLPGVKGADHYSGLASDGVTLWNNENLGHEMVQVDLQGNRVDEFPTISAHGEDLAFDDATFAPKCAVWERGDGIIAYEIPCPRRQPEAEGRMTGGGSARSPVFGPVAAGGFQLHCNRDEEPNNLQVSFGSGHKFHLEEMEDAQCFDDPNIGEGPPPAGFETHEGEGRGRCDGQSADIRWSLTDAGEPGTNDHARITIVGSAAGCSLMVDEKLENGNLQAHRD